MCFASLWIELKSLLCDVIASKYVGGGHDTFIEELLIKRGLQWLILWMFKWNDVIMRLCVKNIRPIVLQTRVQIYSLL